jgi:predicted alpha/beta superfamily hydrolase
MIVVGIGNTDRIRDMTPSESKMFGNSGGAENFHRFITAELIPHIENRYPASSEKMIMGHSLGGLFSLYSLVQAPGFFDAHIAISPSIQYNDFEYPPIIEEFFNRNQELHGFLFMSFADEGNGGAFRRLNELYQDILPNAGDHFDIYCRQYSDNDHLTALIPAASDALITYFESK